jgi:hypothetical protein
MEKITNIIAARAGGKTERCHGIPHQDSYSVAAHSWGVAMLMLQMWPEDFPRLGPYCLSHDVPEYWSGDVPSPTMRYVPGLREQLGEIEDKLNRRVGLPAEGDLSPEDHLKVKCCDWLEFYFWCREQLLMGNRFALEAMKEVTLYLNTKELPQPAASIWEVVQDLPDERFLARQSGVMKEICK